MPRRTSTLASWITLALLAVGCGNSTTTTTVELPSGDVVKCAQSVRAARTTADCGGGGVVELRVTVSPSGSGVVRDDFPDSNLTQGSERYLRDSRFTLTAMPAAGFSFDRWEGPDCDGSTRPTCTLTLDRDKSITALFRR